MMKNKIIFVIMFCLLLLVSGQNTRANMLFFSFDDPVGDQYDSFYIDVVKMDFAFDDITGAYEIVFTADASNLFQDEFRINVNLFNPDTGTTANNPSFFQDAGNDYNLSTDVPTITLTGTNSHLTSWDIGDRVATTHYVFGNPDGASAFRTSVLDPDNFGWYSNEDVIAEGDDIYATITPVPGAFLLGVLGLGAAGIKLRKYA